MKKVFVLIIFLSAGVQAQVFKFGDVPMEQLEMTVYEKDSTASGVVLFDKGETLIDYYNNSFHVSFKRHVRIKVLTDEGFDLADIGLGYRTSEPEQDIKDIKAVSYTLDGNGNVIKESVGRRDRFKEKVSDSRSDIKFTIPGIKKGTVFEYSYELTSENPFDFPDWYFQREIPVLWSEYLAQIPEWFYYLTFKKGYQEYYVFEQNRYEDRIIFGSGSNTSRVNYNGIEYFFAMKDVPALEDEPLMKISTDYLAHVRFQLSYYQFPDDYRRKVLESWPVVIKDLLENEDFGQRLESSPTLSKATFQIIQDSVSDKENMISIYNHVSQLMDWDDYYGKYVEENLEDIYKKGTGSGSAINMILIQMLREVGINAHPLILSTRTNGEIITMFPLVSQFNHTIAYVEIDEEYYLLDAKNQKRPYNLLPVSALNGEGLLIRDGEVQWIPLQNKVKNNVLKVVEMNIDSSGFKGTLEVKNFGFFALNSREAIDTTDIKNAIKEYEFDIIGDFEIDSIEVLNDVLEESFDYKIYFRKEYVEEPNTVYFNPMITEFRDNNPLKLAVRTFPVDYDYTFDKTLVMNITVPESWVIDEVPQSVLHRLPNRAGEFRRIIQNEKNKIMMNYKFRINKERFTSDEYLLLKELYDKAVSSLAENIVLKR